MSIVTPISIGELWDKYSILLIKQQKITDACKLDYVRYEIDCLYQIMKQYPYVDCELFIQLQTVNTQLWEVEDSLRIKEKKKEFDNEFIEFARSVYYTNDKRAEIKKQINIRYNSIIHETKDYVEYKGL